MLAGRTRGISFTIVHKTSVCFVLNFNVGAGNEKLKFAGKMASNGKITVVIIKDKKSKYHIFTTKHNLQDSSTCKFTIKIDNFNPELGETGKLMSYRFTFGPNDKTRTNW
jgi:hypothetical protein